MPGWHFLLLAMIGSSAAFPAVDCLSGSDSDVDVPPPPQPNPRRLKRVRDEPRRPIYDPERIRCMLGNPKCHCKQKRLTKFQEHPQFEELQRFRKEWSEMHKLDQDAVETVLMPSKLFGIWTEGVLICGSETLGFSNQQPLLRFYFMPIDTSKAFHRIRDHLRKETASGASCKISWIFLEQKVCVAAWKKLHALGDLTEWAFCFWKVLCLFHKAFWKSLASSLEALPALDAWWHQLGMVTSSRLPTYVIWKGYQKKRIARISQAGPRSWVSSWVYMKASQKPCRTSVMIRLIQMTFQTSMCKFLNLWIHMQWPWEPRTQTRRRKWIQRRKSQEQEHFPWHWTRREGLRTIFDISLQAKWKISTTRWDLQTHLQMASRQWPSQHFGKCGRKICPSWNSARPAIMHNAQLVYDTSYWFVQWTDTWSVDKTKFISTLNI